MRSALGCAALGLALLLVAGTFDAEPLYVTGAALILLGAGSAAWIGLGAWGATVRRELGGRSVLEDQPLPLRVEARRGRLPLPPGWIDEPLLAEPVRLKTGRGRARVRVDVTFARRGRRVLAPPALVLRDPFGLAERVVRGDHSDEVLVLPRVFPVRATANGGDGISAHARAALIAQAETEIDGLREHREGSPASRIHWPSVARGAGMMERKLISEADSRPLVVLDPRAPADEEALDAAVRAAASLTVHFAKRGGCGLLLPGDRRAVGRRARPARLALGPRAARARRGHGRPRARRRAEPARARRLRLRPDRRPPAARARAHAGRLPARRPGRDRRATIRARGRRLQRLRGRADRQRGRDGRGRGRRVSTLAAPAQETREGAGGPALPLAPVRGAVLLALAVFGGLHWMRMFDPAEPRRAWLAAAIAGGVILAMLVAARLPRLLRPVAATLDRGGAASRSR